MRRRRLAADRSLDERYKIKWLENEAKRDEKLDLEIAALRDFREVMALQKEVLRRQLNTTDSQQQVAATTIFSPITTGFRFLSQLN